VADCHLFDPSQLQKQITEIGAVKIGRYVRVSTYMLGIHCVNHKGPKWVETNGMDSSSPKRHLGARLEALIPSQ